MEAVQFLFLNYYWIAVLINYLKCDVIVWGRGGGVTSTLSKMDKSQSKFHRKRQLKTIFLLPSFITWSKMVLFILYKYIIMVGRYCLILFLNKVQNTVSGFIFLSQFFKTYLASSKMCNGTLLSTSARKSQLVRMDKSGR